MPKVSGYLWKDESGQPLLIIVLILLAMSAGAGIWLVSGKFLINDSAYQNTLDTLSKLSKSICTSDVRTADKEPLKGRSYCQDVGSYPLSLSNGATTNLFTRTTESTCASSTTTGALSGWCGPYWTHDAASGASQLVDGWGTAIAYDTGAQTLTSYGPNRSSGGNDDITVKIEENIVTKGLILYLDAAKYNGTTFGGTGIATTTWTDLSPSKLTATLYNFNGTASSGWLGTGTTADPYRLRFDGSNDYAKIPDTGILKPQLLTICSWANRHGNGTTCGGSGAAYLTILFKRNRNTAFFDAYGLGFGNTVLSCKGDGTANPWPSYICASGTSTPGTDVWMHACVVWTGTSLWAYYNGAWEGGDSNSLPIDYYTRDIFIGRTGECGGADESNWDTFSNASIAVITMYNRVLSTAEISQNCKAMKGRFAGISCS